MSVLQTKRNLVLLEHKSDEFVGADLLITEEDKPLQEFLKQKDIEIIQTKNGLKITVGSYIGSIEFSNFTLTVNPKFTNLENIGRLIEYGYGIKDEDVLDSEIKFHEEKNAPMEIIILLFVNQCRQILRKGLFKSYVLQNQTIPYLRGKLLLNQQIRNDSKFNLHFTCQFDELTANNVENQILLFCLQKCYILTQNINRKSMIRQLIHQLDSDVESRQILKQDFSKISFTRLNSYYKKPLKLAEIIFEHLGFFDYKNQRTSFILSYFVPMEKVYEYFLTQLFSDYYELSTRSQMESTAWMINGTAKNIRPDIITYDSRNAKKGSENSIIDAKYMTRENFGESQAYQMAFYLHEFGKKVAYAILPVPNNENPKTVTWTGINQDIKILVKFINVNKMLDMVYSQKDMSTQITNELVSLVPTGHN